MTSTLPRLLFGAGALGLLAITADCTTRSCTEVGCESSMTLAGHVQATPASLAHAHVTACRNGTCATGEIIATAAGAANVGSEARFVLQGALQTEGTLVEETDGWWRVDVLAVEPSLDAAKDGDGYTLTIVDAHGTTLLDVNRNVNYETFEPNGQECGPTCHDGVIDLWAQSASGGTCSAKRGACGAMITVHPAFVGDDAIGAVMTVCRNDECVRGAPLFNAAMADGVAGVVTDTPHALAVDFTSKRASGSVYDVTFDVAPELATLVDGDVYHVTITTKAGAVLIDVSASAMYAASFPNGAACDAVPCKTFAFDAK